MTAGAEDRTVELLERISKLLTILVTHGLPDDDTTQKEHILLLSSAGLQPREIAEVLDTTPGTVSVSLSKGRKRTQKEGE